MSGSVPMSCHLPSCLSHRLTMKLMHGIFLWGLIKLKSKTKTQGTGKLQVEPSKDSGRSEEKGGRNGAGCLFNTREKAEFGFTVTSYPCRRDRNWEESSWLDQLIQLAHPLPIPHLNFYQKPLRSLQKGSSIVAIPPGPLLLCMSYVPSSYSSTCEHVMYFL